MPRRKIISKMDLLFAAEALRGGRASGIGYFWNSNNREYGPFNWNQLDVPPRPIEGTVDFYWGYIETGHMEYLYVEFPE